jgi:hypothetical protein
MVSLSKIILSFNNKTAKRLLSAAAVVCLLSAFAGCAPTLVTPRVEDAEARAEAERQREMALSVAVNRYERLLGIGWPLLVAGEELCGRQVQPLYGFLIHDREVYGREYEDVAGRHFKIGEGLFVRYVHPDLPAAAAGLKKGDRIITLNGRSVEDEGARMVIKRIRSAGEKGTLWLGVESERKRYEIEIKGVSACRYALIMVHNDSVNAFADGNNVGITTGMMRFVETDEELSIVVAHEMSHNALGHLQKMQGNIFLGSLLDVLIYETTGVDVGGIFGQIGGLVFSQAFESEADYAGLYVAARAGYDITGAANLWRRMAVEHPGSIEEGFLASHPSTPKRFLAIERTIKEIDDKRTRGEPLVPEKK